MQVFGLALFVIREFQSAASRWLRIASQKRRLDQVLTCVVSVQSCGIRQGLVNTGRQHRFLQ